MWSLLNPLLYLVVFYVVFQVVPGQRHPVLPDLPAVGPARLEPLLGSLPPATGSIVGNGSLVKKVSFPREILPLASVGAALVHFFLQTLVLFAVLAIVRYPVPWGYVLADRAAVWSRCSCSPPRSASCCARSTCYVRDTAHLLELVLLAWFWMTPIVYPYELVAGKLGSNSWVALLNPMTPIVLVLPARHLRQGVRPRCNQTAHARRSCPTGRSGGTSRNVLVVLVGRRRCSSSLAVRVFGRLEGDFAEEI